MHPVPAILRILPEFSGICRVKLLKHFSVSRLDKLWICVSGSSFPKPLRIGGD
jgi:hypothetical protein